MKPIFYLLLISIASMGACNGQNPEKSSENIQDSVAVDEVKPVNLIGAWEADITSEEGKQYKMVSIMTNGYMSTAQFDVDRKDYEYTFGGSWEMEGNTLKYMLEFHTIDSNLVGNTVEYEFATMENDVVVGKDGTEWKRIDDGFPGDLEGAWLITGRQRGGEMRRSTPGERKTMKILSGTRFQWIAYHTGTGKYFGTGGGTYTTKDGKYTENIEFFSRDSSRVGAYLEFEYKLDSGEWHHSGFSSKGDPMYEIWTPRSMLD